MSITKFPQPIISKMSIISTVQEKYKYLNKTLELLQQQPDMFEKVAEPFLYMLNMNTCLKQETIFDIFKFFIQSKEFETTSILTLMAYFLKKFNNFDLFEPSLKGIKRGFDLFQNNLSVYYNNTQYNFREFEPISYTVAGYNIWELIPYYGYIATFYINGRPYRFTDDMGTEALQENLYASLEAYLAGHYKKLFEDLQLKEVPDLNNSPALRLKFKNMLTVALAADNMIQLRNDFMMKQDILDECVENQNELSDDYLYQSFQINMNKLVELLVEFNPFKKYFDKFPTFEPMIIDKAIRDLNIDKLLKVTEYCVTGGNAKFMFDKNFEETLFNSEQFLTSFIGTQTLKTNIDYFKQCFKNKPFSSANVYAKMLTAFIRKRFVQQQESIFETLETPDISGVPMQISLTLDDFVEDSQDEILSLFLPSLFNDAAKEMNIFVNFMYTNNAQFKFDVDAILRFENLFKKIYSRPAIPTCISTYFLSFLKDYVMNYIKTYEVGKIPSYISFVLNYDPIETLMNNIYDFMIGVKICKLDEYAKFVNLCEADLDKYLLSSKCYTVYVKSNNDSSELYSIGGRKLYDKMLDINPFNRGYEFIKQILGTTEDLEIIHVMTTQFNDPTTISILSASTNQDTIIDIVNNYANQVKNKQEDIIQNYSFEVTKDNQLKPIMKVLTYWTVLDYISVLKYAFEQITGNYISDMVVSREIVSSSTKEPKVGFIGSSPVMLQESGSDTYMIPKYKYVSEWFDARLNFVNPNGYKLIQFNLDKDNMSIFLFTKTDLKSVYDNIIDM